MTIRSCLMLLCSVFIYIVDFRVVLSFGPRPTFPTRSCHRQNNDLKCSFDASSSRHHCNRQPLGDEISQDSSIDRRNFFTKASAALSALGFGPSLTQARGLVMFPCETPLYNTYHVMRAGQTLLEEEDILTTNPLFLTNREAALSAKGIAQVEDACRVLERNQINPSVIKYSLAASSMDTTNIVKEELKVGQNRIIPEFTFMDPRGIGQWDMMSYAQTLPAVIALDEEEAGKQGKAGRPPPNEDGTPNETLADQSVRLVQLISVLESQFQGDTVLLIFPDGTSPALLSCMMAGIPYNKVHELEFAPGEVRLDLTMQSVRDFYAVRKKELESSDEYRKTVETGKAELQRLRSMDPDQIVSKKDLKIEKERLEIDEQQRRRDEERQLKEERERQARLIRQQELEELQQQQRQARIQKQQEAELARMKRNESFASTSVQSGNTMPLAVGGVASVAVVAALATGNEAVEPAPMKVTNTGAIDRNGTDVLLEGAPEMISSTTMNATKIESAKMSNSVDDTSIDAPEQNGTTLPSALPEVSLPSLDSTTTTSEGLYAPQPSSLEEKQNEAESAMQAYLDQDDGGEDWLVVMGQLMQEDDVEENDDPEEKDDTTSVDTS